MKLVQPNNPVPFVPFGAVPCCPDIPPELWPLISPGLMDFFHGYGANMFHFRMGPFYGDAEHESAWVGIGGAYAGGPGSDWNPAFWLKVRELLDHAGNMDAVVEIVVVDTWVCKHATWGDVQMPWPQADIAACGIAPSPEQEKFIRKVVRETGEYANVIYITDNEGALIRGTTRTWYEWVRNVIRDEESKLAFPVVHMVGTNNTNFADGPFDYTATHDKAPLTAPIAGKHTENNERNPAFSPEQEAANFKAARDLGLHYWYWRADQTVEEMVRTLELIKGNTPVGCFAPDADDPLWVTPPVTGAGQMKDVVLAAEAVVGNRCGTDHQGSLATLGLLAEEIRRQGYCASGPSSDALAVLAPDGEWEEYHAVAFTTGCYSQNPDQLPKYRWHYNGTTPFPTGCTGGSLPTGRIDCKLHQATRHVYDCTPKINGSPIRPEGDPERSACEVVACGGTPTFTLIKSNGLSLWPIEYENVPDNPYQFAVSGVGSATLSCTCPSSGGNLCAGKVITQ